MNPVVTTVIITYGSVYVFNQVAYYSAYYTAYYTAVYVKNKVVSFGSYLLKDKKPTDKKPTDKKTEELVVNNPIDI